MLFFVDAREYQTRTVDSIIARWRMGPARIACVAPTGAGKTHIAQLVTERLPSEPFDIVCHTRDLVKQTARRLGCGMVMAGEPLAESRVRVCSVQTVLSRDYKPRGKVILDEMHHYASEEWSALRGDLGLTATPERSDGVGLRPYFDELIVAAHYSELIKLGHIVDCRVLRPKKRLRGIAQDPVTAYLKLGEGRVGFTFCRIVADARDIADKYTAFGVPAACVDFESDDRDEKIAGLGSRYQMLTSVYALTEGVDVPAASCCVLARGVGHPSVLLQMAGRVLRSYPGKQDALLLDLPGVTWTHGLPTEDREYTLDGIKRRKQNESLRVCQRCGRTSLSAEPICVCGFKLPPRDLRPKVMNAAVGEHAQLEQTLRLSGLIQEAKRRGYQDDWVAKKYKMEYGKYPKLPDDPERQLDCYAKLKEQAMRAGASMAQAAVRFKQLYGVYPPRSW